MSRRRSAGRRSPTPPRGRGSRRDVRRKADPSRVTAAAGARVLTGDPLDRVWRAIRLLRGRAASPEERARFERYLSLIVEWNRVQRLTGLRGAREIAEGLILDSLLFLPVLPQERARMVDVGAGAGIPGIPLKLVEPGIALTLIESREKRVSFLGTAVRELGLTDTVVLSGRAERLIQERPDLAGSFNAAVARAVAPPQDLFPVLARYLAPGGTAVISGPPSGAPPPALPAESGAVWQVILRPDLQISRSFAVLKLRT